MGLTHSDNLVQTIRDAGVVGAGGAGYPTYKKIDTRAEVVIANGAECEPLLFKDQAMMASRPSEIVSGLLRVMSHVGADRGIVAVKRKNTDAIDALSPALQENVSLFLMDDVYPAGDEYEVVYHTTGERIPAGGYPTDIGVLVQNVETLYNVFRATLGHPVTHSMVTIHGNVVEPLTAWLPVGMSFGDVIDLAGGANTDDWVIIDGGPMMGAVTTDLSTPVTRVTSGITVVPRDSALAIRKSQTEDALKRFGKSACDQCSLCTEMCPRYLLGYPVQPHLVMRSLQVSGQLNESLSFWAQSCSECSVCSLWACPENLDPRGVCVAAKRSLHDHGERQSAEQLSVLMKDVHPLKAYRSVPTTRLIRRLGLQQLTGDAPLLSCGIEPKSVAIPIQQGAGEPAVPVVAIGDRVMEGDVIGRAPDTGLGVPVHSSIDGTVISVGKIIVIAR